MQRLLLVDDDPDVLETVGDVLAAWLPDVAVDRAADAAQASLLLAARRYDVVLTDYRMPGRDGLDLISECREVQPDAVCVLMTAFRRGIEAGDVKVLAKPMGGDALVAAVREALRRVPRAVAAPATA